jgi:hypothetical protein
MHENRGGEGKEKKSQQGSPLLIAERHYTRYLKTTECLKQ